MASYPSIEFPNNVIPEVFNKNSFVSKALKSDDIITSSLNVLGPSSLNTLQSNSINNTGNLSSNTITCTAGFSSGSIVNSGSISSASIANSGLLTSNTITCASTLTASNGFTVSAGTVSLPTNAILQTNVSGLPTVLLRLQNATGGSGGNANLGTISTNILTINFLTNNQSSIFVTPTANFSLVLTNVPTSQLQAIYKLEIYITGKFYCTGITVNGTSLTMVAIGGMANIASQVNTNATVLIQTFTIFFTGTTTPSRVITELKSTW
jgi:hypothetical protein